MRSPRATPPTWSAAVNFARTHRLRLAVKGGGHSYQGTSNAPNSLLVWTRKMDRIELHDGFVAQGCKEAPQPAVSVGAGAVWLKAYDAVAKAGRYVQGGGCTTVGVAGLIQSGGFGTFSKRYGLAAAGLIEAEVVTADGQVRIANACTNPDLFWGLKGGGGGSLGIVTRLTLRTRELPEFFGGAFATVQAKSDTAYRRPDPALHRLLSRAPVQSAVGRTGDVPARQHTWHRHGVPGARRRCRDCRVAPVLRLAGRTSCRLFAGPAANVCGPSRAILLGCRLDEGQRARLPAERRSTGRASRQRLLAHQSRRSRLVHPGLRIGLAAGSADRAGGRQRELVDSLFAGSRRWRLTLHFNKGLAGAPAEDVAAARDTATNPAAADAFALAISAAEAPPAFAGVPGHEPDLALARRNAKNIAAAMDELRKLVPSHGSYVSESNYFEADWRSAFWGANYPRLRQVKDKVDPDGLFFVHHGVGSEDWSPDGFTRLK